jgi:hypothetical protein
MNTDASPEKNDATNKTDGNASTEQLKLENLGPSHIDKMYDESHFTTFAALAGIANSEVAAYLFRGTKVTAWMLAEDLKGANAPTVTAEKEELRQLQVVLQSALEKMLAITSRNRRRLACLAVLKEQVELGKAASISEAFTDNVMWADIDDGRIGKVDKGREPGENVNDPWFQTGIGWCLTRGDDIVEAKRAHVEELTQLAAIAERYLPEATKGRPPETEVRTAIERLLKHYKRFSVHPAVELKKTGGYKASRSFADFVEAALRPVLRLSYWGERRLDTAIGDVISSEFG